MRPRQHSCWLRNLIGTDRYVVRRVTIACQANGVSPPAFSFQQTCGYVNGREVQRCRRRVECVNEQTNQDPMSNLGQDARQ